MTSKFDPQSSPAGHPVRRWLQRIWRRLTRRGWHIQQEDALKYILAACLEQRKCTLDSLAGTLQLSMDRTAEILNALANHGDIEWVGAEIALTDSGRKKATKLLRAHRLWEQYLAERTGYDESEWHAQADAREHELSSVDLDQLAQQLGDPTHDPHGDLIPLANGSAPVETWIPLSTVPVGARVKIVHIEDEPASIAALVLESGLQPGMTLEVVDISPQQVLFAVEGMERSISAPAAANVHVQHAPDTPPIDPDTHCRLSDLPVGATGQVVRLGPRLRGQERRRLLDLGILPGTQITVQMRSPMDDPVAYLIRGAVIALRASQTDQIFVLQIQEENADDPFQY